MKIKDDMNAGMFYKSEKHFDMFSNMFKNP